MSNLNAKLNAYQPYALAALRMAAAITFFLHGTQKLLSFPAPFQFGQQPITSLLGFGGLIEIVGGVLVFIGLFTRPAAFIMSGTMAVAYWKVHAPQNLYPTLNGGDASILYCFVFFLLVFTGPGAFALDNKFGASKSQA